MWPCCGADDHRRRAVQQHPTLNGIDFLEVLDTPAMPLAQRQHLLVLHCFKALTPGAWTVENIRLEGGERIRHIVATRVTVGSGAEAHLLTVEVDTPGDFSMYTLRLVASRDPGAPPVAGFDPLLSAVAFSFKVECPQDFDCQPVLAVPEPPHTQPDIDYLAKDYASFRQLMLDRLAVLVPQWPEPHAADLGMTLVELLAYVGDRLSYQQDAIATEAYLSTAQRRVSVRRHARLVDYHMHEGCNARVWVQIQVNADDVLLPPGTPLLTRLPGVAPALAPHSLAHAEALRQRPEVFETVHAARLYEAHNTLPFYTWGAPDCWLPAGATAATLVGHFPRLQVGEVVILSAEADLTCRHAVRLTQVTLSQDPLGGRFQTPPTDNPVDITTITWGVEDALPFALCLAVAQAPTSVALGNIVLADHGHTLTTSIGPAPEAAVRFQPRLPEGPLTHAASVTTTVLVQGQPRAQRLPFDPAASASAALRGDRRDVLPAIQLSPGPWEGRRDLLSSAPEHLAFVVETEADGTATLRFGDNAHGRRPEPGSVFQATYRVGNGGRGNVGAEAIAHVVSVETNSIIGVRNPLPAQGGTEPESLDDVRQRAPSAFRTQERAVTPDDYAAAAARHPAVQRAVATFRWTGSWRTVFVTVDRLGGLEVDAAFEASMRRYLERFRLTGYDLEIDGPRYVPLELALYICVQPDYFRQSVAAALLQVFSNRRLPDGQRGVFHPDNLTFGQPIYLSRLYAAAQAVPGVASVFIRTLQRQGVPSQQALADGQLTLGRLEIARLDNDRNFPEHGILRLELEGGK